MIDLIKIVKTNDIKMLRDNLKFYNINIVDEKNNSLLHIAILNNNPEIVSFLVMNSINLNSQNEAGYTPLHFSILYNHFGIFKLLISQRADINLLDKTITIKSALKENNVKELEELADELNIC